MNWIELTDESQLAEIRDKSATIPQVIFKHSTRCSISAVAKSRLERSAAPEDVQFYYLDLIKYRSISNKIAESFQVFHESPQIICIKNGSCIFDESHNAISMDDIIERFSQH